MPYKILRGFDAILPQEAIVINEDTELNVGDSVKIGIQCQDGQIEKPWVTIVNKFSDETFHVAIDNDLVLTHKHGLKDKDLLILNRDQLLAVLK